MRRCRRLERMAEGGLAAVAEVVSSSALEGASEAARQTQDFGLRAVIDVIVVGLLDSTRILVIS